MRFKLLHAQVLLLKNQFNYSVLNLAMVPWGNNVVDDECAHSLEHVLRYLARRTSRRDDLWQPSRRRR